MADRCVSRDEVRDIDRRAIEELGLPGIVLMENAGRGATEVLMSLGIEGPVKIVAGKGNNAGDGFVMARHLEIHRYDVEVLMVGDPRVLKGDALTNYHVIERSGTRIRVLGSDDASINQSGDLLREADWIVDALLGTGTRGEIREPFATVIESINTAQVKVFAVDLPSGLDCDTGKPLGACVRAHHTATFVAKKMGFEMPGASAYTGEVHVVGIGAPRM